MDGALKQFEKDFSTVKIAGSRNYIKIIIEFNIIPKSASLSSLQISKILTIIKSPVISRALQEISEISTKYGGLAIVSGIFRGILGLV